MDFTGSKRPDNESMTASDTGWLKKAREECVYAVHNNMLEAVRVRATNRGSQFLRISFSDTIPIEHVEHYPIKDFDLICDSMGKCIRDGW